MMARSLQFRLSWWDGASR